jgi:hypothetical protein
MAVLHDKGGVDVLDSPGRREAARAICARAKKRMQRKRRGHGLDNAGNCYLRAKDALVRVGQAKPLRCKDCRATAGTDAIDPHVGRKADRERVRQREQSAFAG